MSDKYCCDHIHKCDWCGHKGEWSPEWSQWGCRDECVFKACSTSCAVNIEPSTRLAGKVKATRAAAGFNPQYVARARADLQQRRKAQQS